MRKFKYIYLFAGLLLLASSCTMNNRLMQGAPLSVQMNISMADLEYVGDVTGTSTQSYVLGIPYGGKKYYTANLDYFPASRFSVPLVGGNNRGMNNAMYDAMQQRPDADFLIPFNVEEKVHQEFLGRKVVLTVKAKAFKIKAK
jgi:hypothetical protein